MKVGNFYVAAASALSIAAVASLLSGCEPANSQPHAGMPPPEVAVVTVQPQSVPATFEYIGQTAGSREVEVRARVTGIVLKRNYREGATFSQGHSMFTSVPAPFEGPAAGAEAALASAEAKLAQAKRNSARLKPLFEIKAASQKDYDDAASAEQVAEAEVKTARANLADARLNLGYTRVEAPIAGIASRAQRSEGNYVSGPDVLLTTVSQIDSISVLCSVPEEERVQLAREADAGRLMLPRDGRFEVTVKLADGSVYSESGKPNFTDVRVSGSTSTSEARAELPNPAGFLHPGQFVRVALKGAERPGAILVPQRAVLEGPKGKFVYVVNAESKAEPRPVELGDWQGSAWIVTAGPHPRGKGIGGGGRRNRPREEWDAQGRRPRSRRRSKVRELPHVFSFFYRPPDLRSGAVDLHRDRRPRGDAHPADRPVSRDRPPGRDRHGELPGRFGRRDRADGGGAAGEPDQRRRTHDLHELDLHLERPGADPRHLRYRHRHRQGHGQHQQPRQAGRAAAARRRAPARGHSGKELLVVPPGRGVLLAREPLRRSVHQQLRHAERARRGEAHSRHDQRADLRGKGLRDADLGQARPPHSAQAHDGGPDRRAERAERAVRRGQGRADARRRPAGARLYDHHQGPARRSGRVREHHRARQSGRLDAAPEGRRACRAGLEGL